MPDPTPDVTTTPNFDPGRVAIASGWLVYDVGYHTCGGYGPESGYAHEPGCGAEPMCEVTDIPDILAAAAERDALAESVRAYGRTIDRWGLLIIAATHSEDITTPDGDGDWEVIESRLAEVPALLAERDALAATVERVRALHHEGAPFVRPGGQDRRCSCGGRWPCPTIRALDTTPDTGGES